MTQVQNNIDKKRIVKNTLYLYIRMLAVMLASLFSVRMLFNALGVEDYGIYNAVAGVVTLFSFLSSSMASATQRYFSFALGKNDSILLNKIFCTNFLVYMLIALFAIVLLETVGLWFVNYKLVVPPARLTEVNWVYQFAILTLVCQIFTSPLIAIIIAHEDMHFYTYASFLDVFLKLITAFAVYLFPANKIVYYAFLYFSAIALNVSVYLLLCRRKYPECRLHFGRYDKTLLKEIFGFTGWTLFGSMTTAVRGHLLTLLLNQMFTPVVVAAKVIALNVSGVASSFSNNFNVGLYPPIVKSYASGAKQEMYQLIYEGCKVTFFLMWVLTLPLLLRMDYVLTLWLKNPPEGAVLFARLALIEALILSVSLPLTTAARATGNMKAYELTLGSMQLAIFPVSWIVLKSGAPAYSIFLVAIAVNILMFFVRLILVRQMTGLPMRRFILAVMFPVLAVSILSLLPGCYISRMLPAGFIGTFFTGILTFILSCVIMFFLGFDRKQKDKIRSMLKNKLVGVLHI